MPWSLATDIVPVIVFPIARRTPVHRVGRRRIYVAMDRQELAVPLVPDRIGFDRLRSQWRRFGADHAQCEARSRAGVDELWRRVDRNAERIGGGVEPRDVPDAAARDPDVEVIAGELAQPLDEIERRHGDTVEHRTDDGRSIGRRRQSDHNTACDRIPHGRAFAREGGEREEAVAAGLARGRSGHRRGGIGTAERLLRPLERRPRRRGPATDEDAVADVRARAEALRHHDARLVDRRADDQRGAEEDGHVVRSTREGSYIDERVVRADRDGRSRTHAQHVRADVGQLTRDGEGILRLRHRHG